MLRLECTNCKTKAQLALKRCKHFELGYAVLWLFSAHDANDYAVATRRQRVRLWSFRCWRVSFHYIFHWVTVSWHGHQSYNKMKPEDSFSLKRFQITIKAECVEIQKPLRSIIRALPCYYLISRGMRVKQTSLS